MHARLRRCCLIGAVAARSCQNAGMSPASARQPRPALFLDRDGIINLDHGYVHRPEDTQLVPGIIALCRRARALGYALVVVTNQAGIARGYYSEDQYHAYSGWLRGHLAGQGALLDAIYHCPHHPDAGSAACRRACACRKPAPGMILDAMRDLHLDLPHSVMLGDSAGDIEAGRRAGVGHLWLLSGSTPEAAPDVRVFADLDAARAALAP